MSVTIISRLAATPTGMCLVLAAVFTGGCDFVANVNCKAGGRVIGSAVLPVPGLAGHPVEQHMHEGPYASVLPGDCRQFGGVLFDRRGRLGGCGPLLCVICGPIQALIM